MIPVGRRAKWRYRQMASPKDAEVKIPVFVAPTRGGGQQEYVPARARQKADVIAEMGNGLPQARLVKLVRATGRA